MSLLMPFDSGGLERSSQTACTYGRGLVNSICVREEWSSNKEKGTALLRTFDTNAIQRVNKEEHDRNAQKEK